MNVCWSRLGGMILSFVICFLTAVNSQDQKWTGYYNPQSSSSLWKVPIHNDQLATGEDLELQSSIRRPSFNSQFRQVRWQNPQSKPQWQTSMYKLKWQDPFSKPQWQMSKAHHLKPYTKRPFKSINGLDKKSQNDLGIQKDWQGRSRPKVYDMWTPMPAPRYPSSQRPAWPEYIPPISMIKPSMDDPHALYNF